jgi:replicative DNA helicase
MTGRELPDVTGLELPGAALAYANYGWPVFPCVPNHKNPLTEHGVLDATTDPARIRDWWSKWPDANIGVATGAPGPDVIDFDIDPADRDYTALAELTAAGILDGHTDIVLTRSGGLHYYYRGTTQRNGRIKDRRVDFRGQGGYVIAPPSFVDEQDGKPAGRYKRVGGDPASAAELDWRAVRAVLDPPPDPPKFQQPGHDISSTGDRPGDHYTAQTSWTEILTPRGWTKTRDLGNGRAMWRRPGKTEGSSATTRDDGGLYVFTTSTEFEPETLYSKLGAYAILAGFGTDYSAAAAQLRRDGYGATRHVPAIVTGAPPGQPRETEIASRLVTGDLILDEPALPPAVWGQGDQVAWSEGESLILAGPDGVGKTTVAGQLVRGRLGIGDGLVLGMPVRPGRRNVLYLMMDRPRQIRRALRRIFTEADREVLKARLTIWLGPPPEDLARDPSMLLRLCRLADADTVIVDSLKDAALKLSDDETGSGWNRARQLVTAARVEILELHHPRKEQADNKRPAALADLYGSRWIPAGSGSVIMLWGKAGDAVVDLIHLKQPATIIGPWRVRLDRQTGGAAIDTGVDLIEQIRQRGDDGITAEEAARIAYGAEDPDPALLQRNRRLLDKLTTQGVLTRNDSRPVTWRASHARASDRANENAARSSHAPDGATSATSATSQVSGHDGLARNPARTSHAEPAASSRTRSGDIYIPDRANRASHETPRNLTPLVSCMHCHRPTQNRNPDGNADCGQHTTEESTP